MYTGLSAWRNLKFKCALNEQRGFREMALFGSAMTMDRGMRVVFAIVSVGMGMALN